MIKMEVTKMKYISMGAVTKPSTEHIVYVSHCGFDYTLTGDLAYMWLNGRFGFDASRNQFQNNALNQLERMGLVVITEDVLEGEYRALTKVRLVPARSRNPYKGLSRNEKTALKWITETGLILSMAELVYLMERDIEPEEKYLGQENVQRLVERIYTKDTIFDNILENQMERAEKRDQVVKLVLSLLKKKRIVLL